MGQVVVLLLILAVVLAQASQPKKDVLTLDALLEEALQLRCDQTAAVATRMSTYFYEALSPALRTMILATCNRKREYPTWNEQRRCFSFLVVSAGITPKDPDILDELPESWRSGAMVGEKESTPVPGYPDLEVASFAKRPAIRELAKALMVSTSLHAWLNTLHGALHALALSPAPEFGAPACMLPMSAVTVAVLASRNVTWTQDGFGTEPNAQLALELFRIAAAQGDPEAQGQMGVRYALGLQDASSWDAYGIVAFGEVRIIKSRASLVYLLLCTNLWHPILCSDARIRNAATCLLWLQHVTCTLQCSHLLHTRSPMRRRLCCTTTLVQWAGIHYPAWPSATATCKARVCPSPAGRQPATTPQWQSRLRTWHQERLRSGYRRLSACGSACRASRGGARSASERWVDASGNRVFEEDEDIR